MIRLTPATEPRQTPDLSGYFVDDNADGEPTIWRHPGPRDPDPIAVAHQRQFRRDPALWDALVTAVQEASC